MSGLNIVKSVEPLSFNVTGTTSSQPLTLGQNAEYCVPFMTHYMGSDMDGYQNRYFLSTTITGTTPYLDVARYSSASTCYVQAYIVEFDPAEVRVTSGSFTLPGIASTTVTVSGINTAKAILICRYRSSETSRGMDAHAVRFRFLTTVDELTDIEFVRGSTGGTITGTYYIIEDLNDNFDVDCQTWTQTGVDYYRNLPTTHNLNNTMILTSYYFSSTDENPQNNCIMSWCRTDFSVYTQRNQAGANSIYVALQRVKFNVPDSVRMVMRYHRAFTSASLTYDWTLDNGYTVNLDSSMVHNPTLLGTGYCNYGSTNTYEFQYFRVNFTDFTTVHMQRGEGSTDTSYCSFEVIDWNGYVTRSGIDPLPKLPELDNIDSMVRSIEEVAFTTTTQWYDHILTKGQDVDNCVPFISYRTSSTYAHQTATDVYFYSPDIMRLAIWGGGTNAIKGYVVEFEPDQVRVQQGEFYFSGTSTTVTISGVDLSKAALKFYWQTSRGAYFDEYTHIRGRFSSSTELEFYRYAASDAIRGHYYVFEALDDQFEVQSGLVTMSSTAVDGGFGNDAYRHRSFCLFSYAFGSTDQNPQNNFCRGWNISRKKNTFYRNNAGAGPVYVSWFTITLKARNKRVLVQTRMPAFSSTSTITSNLLHNINPETSIVTHSSANSAGQCDYGTSSRQDLAFANVVITTSGTLTLERNSNLTNNWHICHVIDFVGSPFYDEPATTVADTSLIVSFEAIETTHDEDYHIIMPTKGQNLDNCVPFMTCRADWTGGYIYRCRPEIYFEDGMIHLKTVDGAYNRYPMIYLVEFNPARVKVQQGRFYMIGTTSHAVTIEEVDTTKTFITQSWHSDTSSQEWTRHLVRSILTSSMQVTFDRGSSGSSIYGSFWVVESLDDAFTVQHATATMTSTGVSTSVTLPGASASNVMLTSSYRRDSNTDTNPQNSGCRSYFQHIPPLGQNYFNRNQTTGGLYTSTCFITFAEEEGVFVQHRYQVDLPDSTWSTTYPIGIQVDMGRSMVFSPVMYANARNDNGTALNSEKCFHRYKITTSGTEVECTSCNPGSNIYTYGAYQVVQWPEPKNKYIDGYVTEKHIPVARTLRLYDRDTGELVSETVSRESDGYYILATSVSGEHYVVALDDETGDSYNALIADKLDPEVL